MIGRMRELVRNGESFALETTCAGKSYIGFLQKCKVNGWRIVLVYLWLPTPKDAIARVARRVAQGGHNISEDVIVRRFHAGLWNMRNLYLPLADEAAIYDNTDRRRILIAEKREGMAFYVHDLERWATIEVATR